MRTLLLLPLLVVLGSSALAADLPVKVIVEGKACSFSPAARVRNGVTYVPLRQGAQALGLKCTWLPQANAARVCSPQGCALVKKTHGIIVDGALLLPVRTLGDVLRAQVTYDSAHHIVTLQRTKGAATP